MDFQFWIWLIIVVATLLSRALKKTAKGPTAPEQPRPASDSESDHKPMTFEELLREIQASKTPAPSADRLEKSKQIQPAKPIQQAKSYEVDYDDDIEEEEKDYEKIPTQSDDRSYEIYEKAKQEAFSRPSLEETMKVEDTIVKYSHFKEYDNASQKSWAADVLKDFKDPEGFRKAFIMSEILKRRF